MTTKIKSGLIADNAIVSAHISSGAISSAHLSSIDTDNVSEGSSNLYFTTARARTSLSVTDSGGDGSLAYDNSTGAITYTGPSAAEVRAHISVTDSGGDGSLAYSNGVITYVGPSASEVRAHLSAGTGVTYSSGAISIGQSVATTASPTFADINVTGNINVTGDLNTVSVADLDVTDQTITLGAGQNEASSGGSGIVVDGSSASILWDEANDEWDFNKSINVTGNIAVSGTVDGVDIAARDAVLTSTTTTAGAALPKAGGSLTGALDITAGGNQLTLSRSGFDNILFGTGTVNGQVGFHITNSTDSVVPFSMHENAPAATLVIDSSGNVGIGTNNPLAELNVDGRIVIDDGARANPSGGPSVVIDYQTISDVQGRIRSRDWDGSTWKNFTIEADDIKLLPAGNVGIGTDDVTDKLTINANAGDGITFDGISASAAVEQDVSDIKFINRRSSGTTVKANIKHITHGTANGSALTFGTTTGSGATERMRIDSSGKVGIGTDSPSRELHVYKASGNVFGKIQSGSSGVAGLMLQSSAGTSTIYTGVGSAQGFQFYADGTSEAMRITSLGTVGISNSNPPTTNTFHGDMFVGPSLYIANYSSGANQQSVFGNNTYYNNGYKAITGDTLGAYMNVAQGAFTFNTAPTVSANAAQTFTAKMKLDGEGNLFLNTESAMPQCFASFNDHSNGEAFVGISAKNDNNVGIRFGVGTDRKYIMYRDGSNALRFYNNAETKETFRIGGSNEGNYLIAQSNSQVRLVLGSTGNATNNSSNWIRGTGNELGLNTGGGIMGFEIGGTEAFRIRTDGGLQFPDNNTFIATSNVAGGTAYEWGAIRRPATADGGQLSIRQYSSGDTAAGYPALAGGSTGWDENTGVYFPAVDQVGFTAGGNPTLTVEAGKQIQRMANGFTNSNGMYRTCLGGFGHATTYNPGSSGTGTYMHFKTNVAKNNKMFRFEYRGYGYNANNIDTSICGYTYEGTSYVYSPVIQDTGDTTCNFKTPYYSSDNKLVLVIQITNNYTGGVMWAQFVGSHHIAGVAITSTKFSSSTTGAY